MDFCSACKIFTYPSIFEMPLGKCFFKSCGKIVRHNHVLCNECILQYNIMKQITKRSK